MSETNEMNRKVIEVAIAAGRHYQQKQTGFLHYYHHQPKELVHFTIPFYENLLFALALLRSRLTENVREAQSLLKKLLSFQSANGNFPFYLHDYPKADHFALAIQLLAPFYHILKSFSHVLGQDLREAIENAIHLLCSYLCQLLERHLFSSPLQIRAAFSLLACGEFFHQQEWKEAAEALIGKLSFKLKLEDFLDSKAIAHLLVAFSLVETKAQAPIWKQLQEFIACSWQTNLSVYCGPCLKEKEDQSLVSDLYVLYMQFLTKQEILILKENMEQLQAALIYPIKESESLFFLPANKEMSGKWQGLDWYFLNQEKWALSLVEKEEKVEETMMKSFAPLKLLWEGEKAAAYSLVCQGGNANICYQWQNPYLKIDFTLSSSDEINPQNQREVALFLDRYPELAIMLGQERSMVFNLGEKVSLSLQEGTTIFLVFDLLEGEGNFLGHISQANRPGREKAIDPKEGKIEDWTLFIRTLRRSKQCKIRLTIDLTQLQSSF